uniref:PDZ domain-containing protein n=1 Tax=Wuchereria bancrofti TaxID=6293 RepID=A0AAF5RV45_WUCBA
MAEIKLLLKRSSINVPYGFIIRHITSYPFMDSSNEGMKCTQKPLYALIILNVKPSSAADEAGLQAGHQIIKMNGQNVNHLTYSDICRITERLFYSMIDLLERNGKICFTS